MGVFKGVIEPGALVLIFTLGTLINRRVKQENHVQQGSNTGFPKLKTVSSPSTPQRPSWFPDNSVFCNNLTSRFLATFPFLIEIWYWNLTYWVYQLARAYSAHLIRRNADVNQLAEAHALALLHLEQRLNIAIELPIQKFILSHLPWLMPVLAKIYLSHIIVGVCFIVYTYTYLPHATFAKIRRTIAMDNLIAFIVFTSWRCKPPRLMPVEYGYMDVLHPRRFKGGESFNWNNNPHQLTIAAMPSLHFGTSLFIAVSLARFSPHPVLRAVIFAWPVSMLLTILATANHWVMDAVIGGLIPFLGWRFSSVLSNSVLEAIEEWGFWLCRTEKPRADDSHAIKYKDGRHMEKDRAWIA